MNNIKINNTVDRFLTDKPKNKNQSEECDDVTGESSVITVKDGLVEKVNKKFIVEDGRELLYD